jgi:26S proteasome non-ATPase regulatory subunit 9
MSRKETLETELNAQFAILSANQSTMNTPLVDPDGFPRADIDIWAVRHARVRIIEMRNDLKNLVDEIAIALTLVDKDDAASGSTSAHGSLMTNGAHSNGSSVPEDLDPFARVDGVAPNSPAASAVSKFSGAPAAGINLYRCPLNRD